jgi:hypothetical protein
MEYSTNVRVQLKRVALQQTRLFGKQLYAWDAVGKGSYGLGRAMLP